MSKSTKKLLDLEKEFTDDAVDEVKSIQNQTLGVAGRPTVAQRKMQVSYDPEEPLEKADSGFLSGYTRLIKETNSNMQAVYDSIIPMSVDVMAHRSLSDSVTKDNNSRLHMITNQFGVNARFIKTEKKG